MYESSFSISDNLGRRSRDDCVLGNFSAYNAACANYSPAPNTACGQYYAACSNQYVVANNDPVGMNLRLIDDKFTAIADLFCSANDSAIGCETNMVTNDNIALARREMVETANCAPRSKTDSAAT